MFNRDDDGKNIVEVEPEVEQEVKNNGNTVEVKQKEAEKGNNLKNSDKVGKSRLPQQTRYSLRKKINLPARLKD